MLCSQAHPMCSFGLVLFSLGFQAALAQREHITKRQDAGVLKPTVSVTEYTEWTYLRVCERRILSENDWLGGEGFGCTYPFDNSCYCNTARAPVATSYISSAVYNYCSDYSSDYTAVVNLYNQYCSDVSAGTHPQFRATPLTDTVTITDLPAWGSLGECGRRILSEDDWLRGEGLKCPSPWFNNCYCNKNLGALATSYISSCIFKYCSTISAEFDAVVSVYNDYCGVVQAAATATPAAGPAATQGTGTSKNGMPGETNPAQTDKSNPPVSGNNSNGSNNNNTSNNGLSTASLIGIIVSVVCSVLGLAFGVGFKIWQHRREEAKKRQEAEAVR